MATQFTYQTDAVLEQLSEGSQPGRLVSIVVACCGQLEYVRLCVPSVLRHSRQPFELVFVDLGSLDGTAEYLAGLSAASAVPIGVVRARAEVSFAAAYSEGIARSRGEFVVLLSNDTVVSDHWLDHLIALADTAPDIGMVGAMTIAARPPQSVGPAPYRLTAAVVQPSHNVSANSDGPLDLEVIQQFARRWREENRGQWFDTEYLEPFCLLIRRAVLTAIGPIPGQASSLFFDSSELCRRVRGAGYRLACCRDLFIHSFASRPSAGRGTFGPSP